MQSSLEIQVDVNVIWRFLYLDAYRDRMIGMQRRAADPRRCDDAMCFASTL